MHGTAGGLCSQVRPGRGAGGASMVLCFVSRKLFSSRCILKRRNFHDLKNESPDGRGTVGTVGARRVRMSMHTQPPMNDADQ